MATCIGCLVACSPSEPKQTDTLDPIQDLMREEFMESCNARSEYASRRRAGKLDKYCSCIFKTTMQGLSEDDRLVAGIYLYGEQHEAFQTRFRAHFKGSMPDVTTMDAAIKAVAKAAKSCR